jgi:hypothetical protein
MELVSGYGCAATVPFSFSFATHHGRTICIHRTKWNRLDVSDAASGELLTARDTGTGKSLRLDYFHGGLQLSPGGARILDDGWIWHPVGMPVVWDVERWLNGSLWESEDGASRFELCGRAYYWDNGMCWLDHSRVAIGGIGDDDLLIVPGARIFELRPDGGWREVFTFPGPSGAFLSDGIRLYSADDSGLSVWDAKTGVRIGRLEGFQPQKIHPRSHELIALGERRLSVWTAGSF